MQRKDFNFGFIIIKLNLTDFNKTFSVFNFKEIVDDYNIKPVKTTTATSSTYVRYNLTRSDYFS